MSSGDENIVRINGSTGQHTGKGGSYDLIRRCIDQNKPAQLSAGPHLPRQREELQKAIDSCNQRSGLHMQLVCGRPEPFSSLRRSYGLLKGVHSYLVLAGPAEDPDLAEKCGYYGEELVLTAAAMGLGTCWVGGPTTRAAACAI